MLYFDERGEGGFKFKLSKLYEFRFCNIYLYQGEQMPVLVVENFKELLFNNIIKKGLKS